MSIKLCLLVLENFCYYALSSPIKYDVQGQHLTLFYPKSVGRLAIEKFFYIFF